MPPTPSIFLTAEWRYLAMLNYEIEPAVLAPRVPPGTELDTWQGKTLISMVGFLFRQTRVLGLPIPLHTNFEEVNLRFYVRRRAAEGWRRGVVFIKELVPRWAIATTARLVYNENYQALPMRHRLRSRQLGMPHSSTDPAAPVTAEYGWRWRGRWNRLWVQTSGEPQPAVPGSEVEFITEHYWGYATQRDGGCVEYAVEHPPWRIWSVGDSVLDADLDDLYGRPFADALRDQPTSAFLADGSAVVVRRGRRLGR
ncbi:MAG: DUF2071 domain-containing protein [Chloroflexota bacterium]